MIIFLDGMPCDRVNEVIIAEEDKVQWKRRICVHKDVAKRINGCVFILSIKKYMDKSICSRNK